MRALAARGGGAAARRRGPTAPRPPSRSAEVEAGLRGGWQTDEEREVPVDWRAVLFVGAGLLANVLLIVPTGFTLASVVMFVLVAHGFGSRQPLRDAGIALAFALAAYFGFAKALGVNIGAGVIERLLGG